MLRAAIRDSAVAGQTDTHQVLRQFFLFGPLLEWDTEEQHLERAPTILIIGQRPILSLVPIFRVASKENGSLTHPRSHSGKLPSLYQSHGQQSFRLALFLFKGTNAQIAHSQPVFPQNVYSWSRGVQNCSFSLSCSSRYLAWYLTFAAYWWDETDSKMKLTSPSKCLSLRVCVISLTVTWLMNGICWTTENNKISFLKAWSWLLSECKATKVKKKCLTWYQKNFNPIWSVYGQCFKWLFSNC